MPVASDRYVLHGGQAGYNRLLALSRERWPGTEAVLKRAGLQTGMSCFDLGCGGGEVTLEIARWVGPSGSVVGLDMDSKKLELARKAAAERGLKNVEFRVGTVADWEESGAYDLVFSRYLFQHLRDPVGALAKMWAAVRSPGSLVVEDADFAARALYPPDPGFEFYHRMTTAGLRRGGGDPEAGRKLFHWARSIGVTNPEVSLVSIVRVEGEGKFLPLLTLDAYTQTLLTEGLASPPEIASARQSMERALSDPETLLVGPLVFQLIGRKA